MVGGGVLTEDLPLCLPPLPAPLCGACPSLLALLAAVVWGLRPVPLPLLPCGLAF